MAGNFRSGRRRRGAQKCEEMRRIELAHLRTQGMLEPGRRSRLSWTSRGMPAGWIEIAAEDEGLRLLYRCRRPGEGWTDVDELVRYAFDATPFGRRQWFLCSCGRRCRILYGGDRFRCRTCHRLRYESQYEARWERDRTKAERIRRRLGDSTFPIVGDCNPFPERPRGMWRRTYQRLAQQDSELMQAAGAEFERVCGAFLQRISGGR